ncbi:MAG: glycosyltransferase [Flavobacteriales bacterium]|nr:glycosyltransferase [Flavobacteriales bacterium]
MSYTEFGTDSMKNILILSHSDPGKTAGILSMDVYRSIEKMPEFHVEMISNLPNTSPVKFEGVRSIWSKRAYELSRFPTRVRKKINRITGSGKVLATDPKYCVLQHGLDKENKMTSKIIRKLRKKPDVILVTFMQGFLTFKNLLELHQEFNCKIIVYMMDMAPLTGGCHYAWDCTRYFNNCGKCPAYYSETENDQSRSNWEFKKASISKTPIELIGGSQWLLDQALKSGLFKDCKWHKLFTPIDSDLFKPRPKHDARKQLGIPVENHVIFFGANSVTEERKGFRFLLEALEQLNNLLSETDRKVHLAIAGSGMPDQEFPLEHTALGHLSHQQLAMAFAAADIFVSPSIEDSGPMMVNQSIMAGTPVVAFKTGVALDLIDDGKTGFLAECGNSEQLAEAIYKILTMSAPDQEGMRENCRLLGVSSMSIECFGTGLKNCLV